MHPAFTTQSGAATVPITFVTASGWTDIKALLDAPARAYADASGFEPKPGRHLMMPAADGSIAGVLFGIENVDATFKDPFLPGSLPGVLPAGAYRFANAPHDPKLAALAFALGAYKFTRYRKPNSKDLKLVVPDGVDAADLSRIAEGVYLARDLVNTPSNDMGPAELHEATRLLAEKHGAWLEAVVGDNLLIQNFPLIHAVGTCRDAPPAANRFALGRQETSQGYDRRQRRVFRYRRPRSQARKRHADHEEGYGRRGSFAGARAHDHGSRTESVVAGSDPGCGEFGCRQCLPSARRLPLAQGANCRNRQHGCGGASCSC